MSEKRVNVLHIWTGSDAEGRAVRSVSAISISPEQEAVLAEMFGASLFHVFHDLNTPDGPDPDVHIEIRACMPSDKPRG